jgi:hypothetical protein
MHTTVDACLNAALAERNDHPQKVAERLSASIGLIQARAEFAPSNCWIDSHAALP